MIIEEQINSFTREKSYMIRINIFDDHDIEPEEIAECFKAQYPKEKCVIAFAKIEKLNMGLIIVGLKLPKGKK